MPDNNFIINIQYYSFVLESICPIRSLHGAPWKQKTITVDSCVTFSVVTYHAESFYLGFGISCWGCSLKLNVRINRFGRNKYTDAGRRWYPDNLLYF